MLRLNSPRWSELKVHIPDELPPVNECIMKWKKSLGRENEFEVYNELLNQFLHQDTILSSAFAVVPHIVASIGKVSAENRVIYLSNVALVEIARCTQEEHEIAMESISKDKKLSDFMREHFLSVTADRTEPLPSDLKSDYLEAISKAKKEALDLLNENLSTRSLRILLGTIVGLHKKSERDLARSLIHLAPHLIDSDQ